MFDSHLDRHVNADETGRLAIYLNDHWAASSGGITTARRAAKANEGTALGEYLDAFVAALEAEQEQLADILDRLGVAKNVVKCAGAVIGASLAGMKINGRLIGYSPLDRVVDLETLIAGVTAKLQMWEGLRAVQPMFPELDDVDLETLAGQARTQRAALRTYHREAFIDACAGFGPPAEDGRN